MRSDEWVWPSSTPKLISFDQRLKNGNDHRPASPKRSMAFLRLSLVDQAINKRTQAASSPCLLVRSVVPPVISMATFSITWIQCCRAATCCNYLWLLASESPASSTLLEGKAKMLDMTEEMMKTWTCFRMFRDVLMAKLEYQFNSERTQWSWVHCWTGVEPLKLDMESCSYRAWSIPSWGTSAASAEQIQQMIICPAGVCCCKSTTAVVWGMEALLSDFSARSRTRTSVAMHPSSHSVTLHVRCKYITLATFGKIHRIWHSDALSIKSSLISLISLLGQAKDRVVPAGWSGCLSQKV